MKFVSKAFEDSNSRFLNFSPSTPEGGSRGDRQDRNNRRNDRPDYQTPDYEVPGTGSGPRRDLIREVLQTQLGKAAVINPQRGRFAPIQTGNGTDRIAEGEAVRIDGVNGGYLAVSYGPGLTLGGLIDPLDIQMDLSHSNHATQAPTHMAPAQPDRQLDTSKSYEGLRVGNYIEMSDRMGWSKMATYATKNLSGRISGDIQKGKPYQLVDIDWHGKFPRFQIDMGDGRLRWAYVNRSAGYKLWKPSSPQQSQAPYQTNFPANGFAPQAPQHYSWAQSHQVSQPPAPNQPYVRPNTQPYSRPNQNTQPYTAPNQTAGRPRLTPMERAQRRLDRLGIKVQFPKNGSVDVVGRPQVDGENLILTLENTRTGDTADVVIYKNGKISENDFFQLRGRTIINKPKNAKPSTTTRPQTRPQTPPELPVEPSKVDAGKVDTAPLSATQTELLKQLEGLRTQIDALNKQKAALEAKVRELQKNADMDVAKKQLSMLSPEILEKNDFKNVGSYWIREGWEDNVYVDNNGSYFEDDKAGILRLMVYEDGELAKVLPEPLYIVKDGEIILKESKNALPNSLNGLVTSLGEGIAIKDKGNGSYEVSLHGEAKEKVYIQEIGGVTYVTMEPGNIDALSIYTVKEGVLMLEEDPDENIEVVDYGAGVDLDALFAKIDASADDAPWKTDFANLEDLEKLFSGGSLETKERSYVTQEDGGISFQEKDGKGKVISALYEALNPDNPVSFVEYGDEVELDGDVISWYPRVMRIPASSFEAPDRVESDMYEGHVYLDKNQNKISVNKDGEFDWKDGTYIINGDKVEKKEDATEEQKEIVALLKEFGLDADARFSTKDEYNVNVADLDFVGKLTTGTDKKPFGQFENDAVNLGFVANGKEYNVYLQDTDDALEKIDSIAGVTVSNDEFEDYLKDVLDIPEDAAIDLIDVAEWRKGREGAKEDDPTPVESKEVTLDSGIVYKIDGDINSEYNQELQKVFNEWDSSGIGFVTVSPNSEDSVWVKAEFVDEGVRTYEEIIPMEGVRKKDVKNEIAKHVTEHKELTAKREEWKAKMVSFLKKGEGEKVLKEDVVATKFTEIMIQDRESTAEVQFQNLNKILHDILNDKTKKTATDLLADKVKSVDGVTEEDFTSVYDIEKVQKLRVPEKKKEEPKYAYQNDNVTEDTKDALSEAFTTLPPSIVGDVEKVEVSQSDAGEVELVLATAGGDTIDVMVNAASELKEAIKNAIEKEKEVPALSDKAEALKVLRTTLGTLGVTGADTMEYDKDFKQNIEGWDVNGKLIAEEPSPPFTGLNYVKFDTQYFGGSIMPLEDGTIRYRVTRTEGKSETFQDVDAFRAHLKEIRSERDDLHGRIPELFDADGEMIDGESPNALYTLVERRADGTVLVEYDNNRNKIPDGVDFVKDGKIIKNEDPIKNGEVVATLDYERMDSILSKMNEYELFTEDEQSVLKGLETDYPDTDSRDYKFYSTVASVLERGREVLPAGSDIESGIITVIRYEGEASDRLSKFEREHYERRFAYEEIKAIPADSPFRQEKHFNLILDGLKEDGFVPNPAIKSIDELITRIDALLAKTKPKEEPVKPPEPKKEEPVRPPKPAPVLADATTEPTPTGTPEPVPTVVETTEEPEETVVATMTTTEPIGGAIVDAFTGPGEPEVIEDHGGPVPGSEVTVDATEAETASADAALNERVDAGMEAILKALNGSDESSE